MAKRRREVETPEYLAMLQRLMKAAARRVGDADDVDLAELVKLRGFVDEAITSAITVQRTKWDRSWADIGRSLGITRQAAQQRYGRPHTNGGTPE